MILFSVSFLSIFLLGFQQQCVTHKNYKTLAINSFAISFSQFHLYREIVATDEMGWIFTGLGGTIGIITSIFVHQRFLRREK